MHITVNLTSHPLPVALSIVLLDWREGKDVTLQTKKQTENWKTKAVNFPAAFISPFTAAMHHFDN